MKALWSHLTDTTTQLGSSSTQIYVINRSSRIGRQGPGPLGSGSQMSPGRPFDGFKAGYSN
jgi:hypothetical protein